MLDQLSRYAPGPDRRVASALGAWDPAALPPTAIRDIWLPVPRAKTMPGYWSSHADWEPAHHWLADFPDAFEGRVVQQRSEVASGAALIRDAPWQGKPIAPAFALQRSKWAAVPSPATWATCASGIDYGSGQVTLGGVTISNNSATSNGGGIFTRSQARGEPSEQPSHESLSSRGLTHQP